MWDHKWFSELVFGLLRVRDKQFMNEDSVVFPVCRAVTLHGEHLYPKRTIISEGSGVLHDVHAGRFEE